MTNTSYDQAVLSHDMWLDTAVAWVSHNDHSVVGHIQMLPTPWSITSFMTDPCPLGKLSLSLVSSSYLQVYITIHKVDQLPALSSAVSWQVLTCITYCNQPILWHKLNWFQVTPLSNNKSSSAVFHVGLVPCTSQLQIVLSSVETSVCYMYVI